MKQDLHKGDRNNAKATQERREKGAGTNRDRKDDDKRDKV
jgi:hypothetical protein